MKQKSRSQLHDGDMQVYLRLKEELNPFALEFVAWDAYGTAFQRLSNNRRVGMSQSVAHRSQTSTVL
jgi:hypothetical protein